MRIEEILTPYEMEQFKKWFESLWTEEEIARIKNGADTWDEVFCIGSAKIDLDTGDIIFNEKEST